MEVKPNARLRLVHILLTGAILLTASGVAVATASASAGSSHEGDQAGGARYSIRTPPAEVSNVGLARYVDGPVVLPTIERDLEPVVVPGASLPQLGGAPTDALFVYAHREGTMRQIPFQVDEVVAGAYTSALGSPLDADDEIVFMASDLGGRPVQEEGIVSSLPISPTWYRIEVTDPLSPTMKGWAYVVRSSSLTRTFTQTYASFDPVTERITTTQYTLGFLSGHPGFDYLALNQSGQDILDRTKLRVMLGTLPLTENLFPAPAPAAIKDGPVRVIVQNRGMIGYRALLQNVLSEDATGATAARLSTDFNQNAAGATLYNANTPLGVSIDGVSETLAAEPVSPWWQVSDDTGTLIQVADSSGVGGTQGNYYKDDEAIDPLDTGDQKSYGDVGLTVESPNALVTYRAALYVLPPALPNMGPLYAAQAATPLQVAATAPGPHRLYLPAVLRLWSPPPDTPTLHAIVNPFGGGSYSVGWDPAAGATFYVLQEAVYGDLSGATQVYSGTATSYSASGRGAARYHYRVKAGNGAGESKWSDEEWVDVLWEAEPNDDPAHANGPIVSGMPYRGTFPSPADEKDWYSFELSVAQEVELWLTLIPFGQDYDLKLHDGDISLIDVSAAAGNADEHIQTDVLEPGEYFIEVFNYSGNGTIQPYRLHAIYPD